MRGVEGSEFVPALALQALGGDAGVLQHLQAQGVGLLVLAWAAAGRKGLEAAFADVVEDGFGQDAAGRVVRAQEKDVQRVGGVGHGVAVRTWLSEWGVEGIPGAAGSRDGSTTTGENPPPGVRKLVVGPVQVRAASNWIWPSQV